jgi:hypothetical protein
MKAIITYFLIFMIMLLSHPGWTQQLVYEKNYTGINTLPPQFRYYKAQPTHLSEQPDSTILFLGWGESIDTAGSQGGTVYQDFKKLDKDGNIIWADYILPDTTTPVNPELDFYSYQVMNNGNIILIGKQAKASPYIQLLYILTLDQNGQKVSDTTYYGNVVFTPWCSAKGPAGVLVGGYVPYNYNYQHAYAVKIGLDMAKEWEFQLDEATGGNYSKFNTIIANSDGSFDCFGQTRFGSGDPFKFLYVRLNSAGQKTLIKVYPDTASSLEFIDACAGEGFRVLMGSAGNTIETMKVDDNGNLLWTIKYPDDPLVRYFPGAITLTHEKEFMITAGSYYYDSVYHMPYTSGIYVMKTDSAGTMLWGQDYGSTMTTDSSSWATFEYGKDIVQAKDGKYLVAASDNFNATYGPVLSLIKIAEGYVGVPALPSGSAGAFVYPNPFSSRAKLVLPGNAKVTDGELQIFSVTGGLVRRVKCSGSGPVTISREGLSNGIYFYSYGNHQKVLYRGKFIVY